MSKSTVVSLCPLEIRQSKPGIVPEEYVIAPAEMNSISILHVENASSNVYIPVMGRNFPITIDSEEIAMSIVNDFINGILKLSAARPGIFWVPGQRTKKEIETVSIAKIKEEREIQHQWFVDLVQMADNDWNRSRNHAVITNMQRTALKMLPGEKREWEFAKTMEAYMKQCPACKNVIAEGAVVCGVCRCIVDPEEAKKRGISFAA